MQESEIINRVANSGLTTLNLEDLYSPGERVVFDLKQLLFNDQILREKDLRDFIKKNNWSVYQDKYVAINCSSDAIIPTWAFMLVAIAIGAHAKKVVFGSIEQLEKEIFLETFSNSDWSIYKNAKVVVKGCSKINIQESVYVEVVNKLLPIAHSIMFGEPCSTVPLYKKPKNL
jgi:hypothetical protein